MTRREPRFKGALNRLLQVVALYAPGSQTLRPRLHRWRGVEIGRNVFIGTAVILETSHPEFVRLGDNVSLGIRSVIIAHWRASTSDRIGNGVTHTVVVEDEAFIGPGVIVLPNVTIGEGSVVQAGSVVTKSVPPRTMVRGNPAEAVATCRVPLTMGTDLRAFYAGLRPIRSEK